MHGLVAATKTDIYINMLGGGGGGGGGRGGGGGVVVRAFF